MRLFETHQEPTQDSRTGTATYFHCTSIGHSDSVKVLAYAPPFGTTAETVFAVYVFRTTGWTEVIEAVETSSPAAAAETAMAVLGRE